MSFDVIDGEQKEADLSSLIDDQTLGEMGAQDRSNFDYIMKNKTYIKRFPITGGNQKAAYDKAMIYSGFVLDAILRHHGVKIKPWMMKRPEILMKRLENDFSIRIETRTYDPAEETVYQTGTYIIKMRARNTDMIDHEIIGFISEPFVWQDPKSAIHQLHSDVLLRTTEKI